jgi:ABC-type polysaccharide/polyol phosphate transport system ATPase subunit
MFLVSHALASVKELCDEAIWLHKGTLMMRGAPPDVIAAYTKFLEVGEESFAFEDL